MEYFKILYIKVFIEYQYLHSKVRHVEKKSTSVTQIHVRVGSALTYSMTTTATVHGDGVERTATKT